MRSQGIEHCETLRRAHVKYAGTDTALPVEFGDAAALEAGFEAAHRSQFGFAMAGRELVVDALSVELVGGGAPAGETASTASRAGGLEPLATVDAFMAGESRSTPVYDREAMVPGDRVDGPAILREPTATTVVEPGWQAEITDLNHMVLRRVVALPSRMAVGTTVDPVMLEVFNNLFMSIAEQMGVTLQNTAYSVNIKERLDFSCAVFDPNGNLVANAPHMPVHLGSMGTSVRHIIEKRTGSMKPGDVFMLNDPYHGGTHLPDITVITPVFDEAGDRMIFFVASRGHHADVGGLTPGSMPPDSATIEDEGVLIDNVRLVAEGRFLEEEVRALLTDAVWPARNPDQNIADLKAQIAANEKGVRELGRMVGMFGLDVVHAYMHHVRDNAEEQVRRVLDALKPGAFVQPLDNGAEIRVAIGIDREARRATVDFTGTSEQLASNFNAPSAVVRAAVLYVFRTLVQEDIPMNDGCLAPIDIVVPDGSMLSPTYPAAVVAGNVETSQAVTNALYGALGVLAAAQGTMNNFTFPATTGISTTRRSAAAPARVRISTAPSAVHTHMTNSRLTDPEVLELRFPVLLERFGIRPGSGGAGAHRGGDGTVRRIRFLEEMTASLLANNRKVAPYGVAGGAPGSPGKAAGWSAPTARSRTCRPPPR